jgi:hypothetical protein
MKGEYMMKTSTRLIVTGAASVLGIALVGGGAYAATGSLSATDTPGQVLQVSGVGPASTHTSPTAIAHANARAKGIFGVKTVPATRATPKARMHTPMHATVGQVARPAPQTLPAYHAVMPSVTTPMHAAAPQPMPPTGMAPSTSMR